MDTSKSLTEGVFTAIADLDETDATAIEPPLYEILDPDALNCLFAPLADGTPRIGGRVVFPYCGYEVTAYSDGRVCVTDPDGEG